MPLSLPLSSRLGLFYFAFFFYVAGYVAYFPAYLAWRGLGAAEIAWIIALPALARMIAPTAWGALADRTGWQRGIVAVACTANAACFVLLPYMPGVTAIAWLIAVTGMLSSAALPLVEVIALAALADRPGRYGPVRLWGSVGFIIAVLGGGAAIDLFSVGMLPGALAACALGCLAAALWLPAGAQHAARAAAPLAITRPAQALIAAGFCMSIAHGALYAFLTLHLQREGYSGAAIGFYWTLGVLAEIVVFFYLPELFRRFALSTILVASFACAVVRFLAIGWAAALPVVLFPAQLLHAATFGSFHAASIAAVRRLFPPEAQGRGQTLFSSIGYGAGSAVGALLAGWAWETAGPGPAFSVCSLVAVGGMLLSYSLKRAGV